jgi:hypothetical protein
MSPSIKAAFFADPAAFGNAPDGGVDDGIFGDIADDPTAGFGKDGDDSTGGFGDVGDDPVGGGHCLPSGFAFVVDAVDFVVDFEVTGGPVTILLRS